MIDEIRSRELGGVISFLIKTLEVLKKCDNIHFH